MTSSRCQGNHILCSHLLVLLQVLQSCDTNTVIDVNQHKTHTLLFKATTHLSLCSCIMESFLCTSALAVLKRQEIFFLKILFWASNFCTCTCIATCVQPLLMSLQQLMTYDPSIDDVSMTVKYVALKSPHRASYGVHPRTSTLTETEGGHFHCTPVPNGSRH